MFAAGLVLFGWKKYHERVAALADGEAADDPAGLAVEGGPGIKMDGDSDCIPCEHQFCGRR
jgi:hypothetical protein